MTDDLTILTVVRHSTLLLHILDFEPSKPMGMTRGLEHFETIGSLKT